MKLKVIIHSEAVEQSETKNGFKLKKQTAYIHLLDNLGNEKPYPAEMKISLEQDEAPYKVGTYHAIPELKVNDYGNLEVARYSRLNLIPVISEASPQKKAS